MLVQPFDDGITILFIFFDVEGAERDIQTPFTSYRHSFWQFSIFLDTWLPVWALPLIGINKDFIGDQAISQMIVYKIVGL